MKKHSFSYLSIFVLTALPFTVSGATIITENFDYADGNLTDNPAWTAHSGATGLPISVSSSAATLSHGSGSREDANIAFPLTNSGTISAVFTLTVNDTAPISGADSEYFAHFGTGGGASGASVGDFVGRLDVVPPTDSVNFDYSLGISSVTSSAEATYGTDFTFGDSITVRLDFNLDTGLTSLTVNAGTTTTPAAAGGAGTDVTAFTLRQSNSSSDESITIDSLVISDSTAVPEPSTALLGGLALLGLFRRRR